MSLRMEVVTDAARQASTIELLGSNAALELRS
jgi:hypothetical protein